LGLDKKSKVATLSTLLILRKRGKKQGVKAQKPASVPLSACPQCGKDPSTLPRDITICPYCGGVVPTQKAEAVPAKPTKVERPENVQRIRRYTKMAALLGLLIAVVSFILGPFLGGLKSSEHVYVSPILHEYQNEIGYGIVIGVLIAIFSAIVRVVAHSLAQSQIAKGRELALRWILGALMIILPVIFFGMHWLWLDLLLLYAPGLLIAICLLIPKKYSVKTSIVLLMLALIFAFWSRGVMGPFGPSLSDSWLISRGEWAEWGLLYWTLLCEKILAVIVGILLVAKKI